MTSPANQSPEQWEAEAIAYEVDAIAEQPDPEGDVQRQRAIRRAIYDVHGTRPPFTAWAPFLPEIHAIKSRRFAAARRRELAARCRDYAVLSGIIRATEQAQQ